MNNFLFINNKSIKRYVKILFNKIRNIKKLFLNIVTTYINFNKFSKNLLRYGTLFSLIVFLSGLIFIFISTDFSHNMSIYYANGYGLITSSQSIFIQVIISSLVIEYLKTK